MSGMALAARNISFAAGSGSRSRGLGFAGCIGISVSVCVGIPAHRRFRGENVRFERQPQVSGHQCEGYQLGTGRFLCYILCE